MKNFFLVLITAAIAIFGYRYYVNEIEGRSNIKEESALIQRQMKNVAKLVVTEGHFAQVYNYQDSKRVFGSLYKAKKNMLVVVNAEVTISYDLDKIDLIIDEQNKVVSINRIPEPEIRINPDFEYKSMSADFFNPFEGEDYSAIKKTVNESLMKKVLESPLYANAENRLVSELSNFFVLTRSMGWTLVYQQEPVENADLFTEEILESEREPVQLSEEGE